MAIDGKLHFYKYVEFPSGDNTSTWATAYKEAKKSVFEGLKGYLATITSENEEKYLYSSLGGNLQAWIGWSQNIASRDGYDGFVLDSDEITDEALKPLDDSNKIVRKWSWLCGPEAGTTFYETGESVMYMAVRYVMASTPTGIIMSRITAIVVAVLLHIIRSMH